MKGRNFWPWAITSAVVIVAGVLTYTQAVGQGAWTTIFKSGSNAVYRQGQAGPIIRVDSAASAAGNVIVSADAIMALVEQSAGSNKPYVYARTIDGWPMLVYNTSIGYGLSMSMSVNGLPLPMNGPGRIENLFWVDAWGGLWYANVYLPESLTVSSSQIVKPFLKFAGAGTLTDEVPLVISKAVWVDGTTQPASPMGETFFPYTWHLAPRLPAGFTWPGITNIQTWMGPGGAWMVLGTYVTQGQTQTEALALPNDIISFVPHPAMAGWTAFTTGKTTDYGYARRVLNDASVGLTDGRAIIEVTAAASPSPIDHHVLVMAYQGPKKDFQTPAKAPWAIPLGWIDPGVMQPGPDPLTTKQ